MRFALAACLAAMLVGAASAQQAPDKPREDEKAFAKAREPYRGHYPFAVAQFEPFGEPDWFVLSFFTYWTGYQNKGNAQQHWLVRKESGVFEHADSNDRNVPEVSGHTTWATTETCPALLRAINRFELHERPDFTDGSRAPFGDPNSKDKDVVVISSLDGSFVSFWARIDTGWARTEINAYATADSEGYPRWVMETESETEDCFKAAAPVIPVIKDAGPGEAFSIFRQPDQ